MEIIPETLGKKAKIEAWKIGTVAPDGDQYSGSLFG
jgi:hypothetical protein